MANNELTIPNLNPVRFYERLTDSAVYISHSWVDYRFDGTIKDWEENVSYCRKWQKTDTIRLQFESNFSPIQIDVMDGNGNSFATVLATQKLANKYEAGKFAYEAEIALNSVPEGCYILTMTLAGGLKYMDSSPFCLKVNNPNTMYWEYTNSRYHGDVIFETGIVFSARLESTFGRLITGSQDTIYDNQRLDPFTLSSKATRSYPVVIGGSFGVPEEVDDLQNNIWTCNSVTIDGRSYSKSTDSKAELKTEENYPLYGISRVVREGINRGSKVVSVGINPDKKILVTHVVNAGFFGDIGENGGTNIVTILSKEP